ncbi:MAG: four helix bundle protein [Deltaproteobacteria bacterium]|nr:four helix bundle protein [Deltaproteobacteria bacterium]
MLRDREVGGWGIEKEQFGVMSSEFGDLKMNDQKFDFENLKVYQKALEYVDFVYKVIKGFPTNKVKEK